MAGAPGLQEVERLRAPHLPDRDAVGTEPERGLDEIGKGGRAVLGAERHEVRRRALQLARILDQDDAVVGPRDLGEQRVDERCLAGGGAAGDEHVPALGDGEPENVGLRRRHDLGFDVVVEGEDGDGRLADGKGRARHDRREQAFEALARFRELGGDSRRAGMDLGANMMRDEPHDPLAIRRQQPLARVGKAIGQPVDPQPAVWVEHHLDDGGVFEPAGYCRTKCCAKHAGAARDRFTLVACSWHRGPPKLIGR